MGSKEWMLPFERVRRVRADHVGHGLIDGDAPAERRAVGLGRGLRRARPQPRKRLVSGSHARIHHQAVELTRVCLPATTLPIIARVRRGAARSIVCFSTERAASRTWRQGTGTGAVAF